MASKTKTKKKKEPKQNTRSKTQGQAVVLFILSLFFMLLAIFKGDSFWAVMHDGQNGVLGLFAFVFPFLLGYISIMAAMDRLYGKHLSKIVQCCALLLLLAAAFNIFMQSPQNGKELATFKDFVAEAYENGKNLSGGGFLGIIFSYPLLLLMGATGAKIIVLLLNIALIMFITGTTVYSLYNTASKPVKKIRERISEEPPHSGPRFDIDVDLGDNNFIPAVQKPAAKKPETEPNFPEIPVAGVDAGAISELPVPELAKKPPVAKETEFKPVAGVETGVYRFPPIDLLKPPVLENNSKIVAEQIQNKELLVNALRTFGVETRVINISHGPSVTRYELQPAAGVKISRITNLSDDIALNLAATAVRIEAPIPGKSAIGIEIPNKQSTTVNIREIIESVIFDNAKSKLTVSLGKDISGNIVVADLSKMPHILIAGTTGSGKSVCVNSMIMSLLYRASPEEVKLVMIDPKVVELNIYNGIPHLLSPVVTDPRKAAGALGWAVMEMDKRYKTFAENGVKDIFTYNELAGKKKNDLIKMPQIVIIIDELADLMMAAPNEVEQSICRLAQKARAAGMHLVIATQRPSVDVITGLIKANVPSRIAFAVSSHIDSRTIIDTAGADKLLGRGDMLYYPLGMNKPQRVQGCYISDDELHSVIKFIKEEATSEYDDDVMSEIDRLAVQPKGKNKAEPSEFEEDLDERFEEAVEFVITTGKASTSHLQTKLKFGYARAARIIDAMEEKGIVGPLDGAKPRQILMSKQQWLERNAMGVPQCTIDN